MKAQEKIDMGLCAIMGCAETIVEGILCKAHARFSRIDSDAWPTTEHEYENGVLREENPIAKRKCGVCVMKGCFNPTKKITINDNSIIINYDKPIYEPICDRCKSRVTGLPVSKW